MPNINETFVKKCTPPERANCIHYDDAVKGFGLRVTNKGTKSFILNFHIHGRERRYTIGRFPAWTAAAARAEAKELKKQVDRGEDPLAERIDAREALTMGELWLEFKRQELPRKSKAYQKELVGMWEGRILPRFKNTKVEDVTKAQLERLHRDITNEGHSVRANRVLGSVRTLLSKAKADGVVTVNVAEGCKYNKELPKERYLSEGELEKVVDALRQLPNQQTANAIRLLILTGARRTEVLGAKWAEFDLERGIWSKPAGRVKDRRAKRIPLSNAAIELLAAMKRATNSEYLFPSPTTDGPITEIKRSWRNLKKLSGIPDIRVHDLRHTFASHAISGGHSIATIGALLGHSQAQTTMRYAHLMDEPLREAANQIGRKVTL